MISTTVDRLKYLAAARLAVDTHNKLITISADSDESATAMGISIDEQIRAMARFAADFNRAKLNHVIRHSSGGQYSVLRRVE